MTQARGGWVSDTRPAGFPNSQNSGKCAGSFRWSFYIVRINLVYLMERFMMVFRSWFVALCQELLGCQWMEGQLVALMHCKRRATGTQ
jgi:hypothetical protein